jgi:hypothetical protein
MLRLLISATLWRLVSLPVMLIGLIPNTALAEAIFVSGDRVFLQTSVFSRHYETRPEHNNHHELIGVEWHAPSDYRFQWQEQGGVVQRMPLLREVRWLAGGASFLNSFFQRSTYLYGGGRYDLYASGQSAIYVKVTAGLLNGYRGEYQDKIPFNKYGTAPAVLPALGFQYKRLGVEVIPFGAAGVMVNLGIYVF